MRLLINLARFAAWWLCALRLGEALLVTLFWDNYGVVSRADLGLPPRPASDFRVPLYWGIGFSVLAVIVEWLYRIKFRSDQK